MESCVQVSKKWRHKIFIKFMPCCKDMFSYIPNIISIHFREEQKCHIPTLLRALQMKIGLRSFEELYTNLVLRFILFLSLHGPEDTQNKHTIIIETNNLIIFIY